MSSCEMCGTDVPSLRRAIIEGTSMSVCGNCVKFGVEQAGAAREVTGRSRVTQSLERRAARSTTRDIYANTEELVEDYGARVRKARTAKGMTLDDLGKKLNERVAILAKVETNAYHPEEGLIHKLEKELSIKLKEKPEPGQGGAALPPSAPKGDKSLTLGDLIKQAQSEKKK